MKKITSPHDRFFRGAMSDPRVAKAFFELHLPPRVAHAVDLNTLALRKESFVDHQLKLSITDMLFAVNFNDKPGYLYLLTEHQSTIDRWMPFRIFGYIIKIMQQHWQESGETELPIVYPLVFYNGEKPYDGPQDIYELFPPTLQELARQVLFKPFQLVDVGCIPDEVLRDKVWVGLMEMCMKHVFARDIIPYMRQELLSVFKQIDQAGGREYLGMAFRYLLSGETHDPAAFVKVIKDELSSESGEVIMSIAQQLEAKAFEKGIEKGIEKGRAEGIEKGIEKGRAEGMAEGKREMQKILALKLLEKGMDIATLRSLVDELTLEEIQQLKKKKDASH